MTSGASEWFAGPKAENGDWFEIVLRRIVQDYYAWRRNYFPEDGIVVDAHARRLGEEFHDAFEDRLQELLGRLKADFPFQSPRYAAHMVAEQTLPSIAGYFAAMLYNPNNVSREAASVTVALELEACGLINRMLGYREDSWGHLTSGGTVANLEALWVARTVAYLPGVVQEMRRTLGVVEQSFKVAPQANLEAFAQVFTDAQARGITVPEIVAAYRACQDCVVERGLYAVAARQGRRPVVLVPESHHYCFEKAMDVMGFGREALISVGVDSTFRMDVNDLDRQLDCISAQGDLVVAVAAVVGTTEEGAVDPVDLILDLRAKREQAGGGSFWLHVDGAYGGYLRTMTNPTRLGLGEPWTDTCIAGQSRRVPLQLPVHYACDALERLGEVDSVTIDPHKLGYIPYPAGAICFKSNLVKPLVRQEAPYISADVQDPEQERQNLGVGMYILEGSKPGAAAASVWLSHTLIPLDATGHGQLIQQTVRNAAELHALLESYPEWTQTTCQAVTLTPPGSNIVCYAFIPKGGGVCLADINRLNKAIYARFTVPEDGAGRIYDQKFFVSRTTLTPAQYRPATAQPMLARLGVLEEEYRKEGVFLLRSVLMNPWYESAKGKGRFYLAELVEELYRVAEELSVSIRS